MSIVHRFRTRRRMLGLVFTSLGAAVVSACVNRAEVRPDRIIIDTNHNRRRSVGDDDDDDGGD